MIVLRCLGHAAHEIDGCAGKFLREMDFDQPHDERAWPGSGRATFTDDIAEAKRFADIAEFHAFYRRSPARYPIRPSDGQPNRPMTGYNWQIETVDE